MRPITILAFEARSQAKFPAAETIPKEGTTAWADHWVLTKGAKNLDAAYDMVGPSIKRVSSTRHHPEQHHERSRFRAPRPRGL